MKRSQNIISRIWFVHVYRRLHLTVRRHGDRVMGRNRTLTAAHVSLLLVAQPPAQHRTISEPSCGHADRACLDMSLSSITKSWHPASPPSVAILVMTVIFVLHGVVFPVIHAPLGFIKSAMIPDCLVGCALLCFRPDQLEGSRYGHEATND